MADIELSDDLIELARASVAEREKLAGLDDYEERNAQQLRCVEAAAAFHAAVAAHAEATEQSRVEVEMAAKRAARPAEETAGEQ